MGIRHDVQLLPQVVEPVAFDQFILAGMQTTVVALSQNEVWWYDADTATEAIAVGNTFTTSVLFDTTTYYLEEHYQDDTLLCVSSRSSVTVYVIDTALLSVPNCQLSTVNYQLYIRPNPAEDYLILETDSDVPLWVEIYDIRGILVMKSLCTCPARLDITHLNAGVYFLQATHSDGHREVVKFVKK